MHQDVYLFDCNRGATSAVKRTQVDAGFQDIVYTRRGAVALGTVCFMYVNDFTRVCHEKHKKTASLLQH